MKKLPIKVKITLWYALLLLTICTISLWMLFGAAQRSVTRYCEDTLVSASIIIQDELEVEHGYLEIDDDIDDVPNVYASLFEEDGRLVYGRTWVDLPFEDGVVRTAEGRENSWYIYDTRISVPEWENIWLRLHMSANELTGMRQAAWHYGLWLLPLFVLIALAGGHAITARAFRPVKQMSDVASSIVNARDLSERIAVDAEADGDELHHLSLTLNGMLERLEHAFRREQQFTSDAAHELRTPLNAIITQGEYALSRTDEDEKNASIEQMLARAGDMNAMVHQLLMLARLESGQMERNDVCDLQQLLLGLAEDMQPVAEERGMVIAAELAECTLSVNRPMLTRAVINLMDNAIHYGRENGRISLALDVAEDEVRISVTDDGGSLSEEELRQVFVRFWRADASRATHGTGVGLSLVQSIAKAHGGSVEAESRLGEMTRFTIRLPKTKN